MPYNPGRADFSGSYADTAVVLASGSRTTTQTSADFTNAGGRHLAVFLNMTTVGTGSVTLTIQGKVPGTSTYYTLLAGAAVITDVLNVYRVGPEFSAVANVAARDVIPPVFRFLVTANNANAAVYSLSYALA